MENGMITQLFIIGYYNAYLTKVHYSCSYYGCPTGKFFPAYFKQKCMYASNCVRDCCIEEAVELYK